MVSSPSVNLDALTQSNLLALTYLDIGHTSDLPVLIFILTRRHLFRPKVQHHRHSTRSESTTDLGRVTSSSGTHGGGSSTTDTLALHMKPPTQHAFAFEGEAV